MEFKFLGILKGHNIEDLITNPYSNNDENIELLISKEILIKSNHFSTWIWNIEVFEEMFSVLKEHIEFTYYPTFEIDEIQFSLNHYPTLSHKINYLNNHYVKLFESIDDFVMYKGSEYNDDWHDYIINAIGTNEGLNEIKSYLTASNKYDFIRELINPNYVNINSLLYKNIGCWESFYSIDKQLEFITSKIKELENELNATKPRFKKELQEPKTLKSIFIDKNKYDGVLNDLIKKQIIKKEKDDLIIVFPEKYKKKGRQYFICSIGMQLYNKGYIQDHYDNQAISEALNNTFKNSTVSRQNYDYLKDSPNMESYLSHTKFI